MIRRFALAMLFVLVASVLIVALLVSLLPRDECVYVPGFEEKERALREKYPAKQSYTLQELEEMSAASKRLWEEKRDAVEEMERTNRLHELRPCDESKDGDKTHDAD